MELPILLAGRYEIVEPLGDGTFSETYRAVDLATSMPVAVKVLREQFTRDHAVVARFEREARAAAAVHHPNVVRVLASGHDRNRWFIVMELVEGGTLKQRIQQAAPLPVADALALTQQLLQGLAAIHAAGIVHRDVKPQNVLLTPDGTAKLTDFGIARAADVGLTETGVALGTAAYMAPEQAVGAPLGPPADLYAVGVILFELLTGTLPFPGDQPVAVLYQQVHTPPPRPRALNPGVPRWLEGVVLRALAKDPGRRYPDAASLARALAGGEAAAEETRALGVVPPAPVATAFAGAHERVGIRPAVALLAATFVLLVGALAVIAAHGAGDPPRTTASQVRRDAPLRAATPMTSPSSAVTLIPTPQPSPTATPSPTPSPTPTPAPAPTSAPPPAAPPRPATAPSARPSGGSNGHGKDKKKHGNGGEGAIPTVVVGAAVLRQRRSAAPPSRSSAPPAPPTRGHGGGHGSDHPHG
ncbi:MAG TPA: serine/threonine-protein kinase [Thermomicrobiaceae bacterium]|nr:serine/threonine-protein kinase [Thermomicrobiaceae bacterium]